MQYIFLDSRHKLKQFVRNHFTYTPEIMKMRIVHIITSIIQKKSNSIEEIPLISSVIYNRLQKGMKVQMDGTLSYGPYAHTIVTPEHIRSDESQYNTYKHRSLPPHPLSTVTLHALEASIKPASTNYIFFDIKQNRYT